MKHSLVLTLLAATLGLSACGQRDEMPQPGADNQLGGPTQPAGSGSSGAQSGSDASEGSK